MEYVLVGCRSLIVVVFILSAVGKLRSRWSYAEYVAATARLLPRPAAAATTRRLAAMVLTAELAVVLLLVLAPATVAVGFAVAVVLLAAFTGAIWLAIRRGERAPCRCFGASARPLGYAQMIRNTAMTAVALTGLVGGLSVSAQPELAGALLAMVAGAVVAILVVAVDDIAALVAPG